MTGAEGQTNHNDEHVSNTNGTLTIVKLGDDERRALKWMLPIAVFVGVNLFATVVLTVMWMDEKHSTAVWATMVYTHIDNMDADLKAHGFDPSKYGKVPPPPE